MLWCFVELANSVVSSIWENRLETCIRKDGLASQACEAGSRHLCESGDGHLQNKLSTLEKLLVEPPGLSSLNHSAPTTTWGL